MRRPTLLISPLLALILTGGCASSPPSRFYTLSSASTPAALPSSDLHVVVGPVSVPSAVDRPEIVVTRGPNEVWLDELNRWASPVRDEISRAVSENLVAILGTPHVTQSRTLSSDAAYRVRIEVQRFESAPGEAATLDAVWSVRSPRQDKVKSGRTTVREPVQKQGYDVLAAAHSRTIEQLSRDIADALRALNGAAR